MADVVRDAIAEELAAIERVIDTPEAPFGYGSDLVCAFDIEPDAREWPGDAPELVVEAIIRRITTPRGALVDDGDYGIDVRGFLNSGIAAQDVPRLAGRIRGEIEKDDRVEFATVTVTWTDPVLRIAIRVTPADPRLRAFRFTLAVTSAAVLLEEISA